MNLIIREFDHLGILPQKGFITPAPEKIFQVNSGSAKANGREPKTSLGWVFNYKLGCYDDVHVLTCADAHPDL